MTTKLSDVVVKEVALVPKGANAKRIHLRKEADATDSPEGTDMDETQKIALEKAQNDAKLAAEALEKAQADAKAQAEKIAELEKAAAAATEAAAAEKAALEKAAADEKAKAVELQKALDAEKEAKEVAESIQKASVEFKNLPEKAEDLGPLLRSIRKAAPDAADKIEAVLKKVDAIAKGALDVAGASNAGTAAGTALEAIEKKAAELVKAGSVKTVAEGFDVVLKSDKKLYDQYEREKNAR